MSLFSDVFSTSDSSTLPDWLRTAGGILDEGLDLYDRIAGGETQTPTPTLERTTAAPTASVNQPMMLIGLLAGAYVLYLLSRRK